MQEFDDKKDQLTANEMAKQFGEGKPETEKTLPDFSVMTKAEVEEWEAKEYNSNDIYRIKARVQNFVAQDGGMLTPVGQILCNTFVHMARDLYNCAETLPEPYRTQIADIVRKHESMPANVIAASKNIGRKK